MRFLATAHLLATRYEIKQRSSFVGRGTPARIRAAEGLKTDPTMLGRPFLSLSVRGNGEISIGDISYRPGSFGRSLSAVDDSGGVAGTAARRALQRSWNCFSRTRTAASFSCFL